MRERGRGDANDVCCVIYLVKHNWLTSPKSSGIIEGVLLRRMRAVNPSAQPRGTVYVISDFNVGMNVEICGIVYRIYACDRLAEEYFASNVTPLGEFEEPPDDL